MSALRTTATLTASLLLALLTTGAGNAGVRPGTAEGAELVKTGWWWAGNDSPLDSTPVAPPQPSPPNVPKDALPVAAANGEPEKYTALEFKLEGEPGGVVNSAVLVLRENAERGATVNAETAKILACPVTEGFWADGAAGSWKARPAYDCDLGSAAGERDAASGLWTFDLTAVASLWLAEDHKGSTSVALVEGADAPESFQVAFDGPSAKGIGFAFDVGKAADTSLSALTGGTGTQVGGAAPSGPASGSLAGGTAAASPPLGAAEVAPPADVAAADPSAVAAPTGAQTTPASSPFAAPAWYSGIPKAGYALLPLVLGLAYLLMLALGPDAQPAAGPTKHGVGRALERLRAAGAALNQKGKS